MQHWSSTEARDWKAIWNAGGPHLLPPLCFSLSIQIAFYSYPFHLVESSHCQQLLHLPLAPKSSQTEILSPNSKLQLIALALSDGDLPEGTSPAYGDTYLVNMAGSWEPCSTARRERNACKGILGWAAVGVIWNWMMSPFYVWITKLVGSGDANCSQYWT